MGNLAQEYVMEIGKIHGAIGAQKRCPDKGLNDSLMAGPGCLAWRNLLQVFVLLSLFSVALAQSGPVRLDVDAGQLEVQEGTGAPVGIHLLAADGSPAPADRALQVRVDISGADGDSELLNVTFQPGESSKEIVIPANQSGVLTVRASSEELLEGATLLRVLPGLQPMMLRNAPAAPATGNALRFNRDRRARHNPDEAESPDEPLGRSAATLPRVRDLRQRRENIDPGVTRPSDSLPGSADEEPALPLPRLELRSFSARPLRADGADPAKVFAFLHGLPGHPGITLRLLNDRGLLAPTELHIPSNATTGEARLTSEVPGPVSVDLISTQPEVDVTGDRRLEFLFHPPIDGLDISAPRSMEVGDSAQLSVDLVNAAGIPVRTMESRRLQLRVLAGKIRIEDPELQFNTGDSGAGTTMTADWWGRAEIEVSTANLGKQGIQIQIAMPWGLISIALFGGLLGGLIAWSHGVDKHQKLVLRLLVGLVAGLVLYWVLAYLSVPAVFVRNPFGAFGCSVVGGWLGTEVFDFAARRLGILRSPS